MFKIILNILFQLSAAQTLPHYLFTAADNEVYAWGNNSMGQCGQGNSTGPITKPKKVVGLDGVAIQQISAGTSHSLAWTALPRDRSATVRVNTPVTPVTRVIKEEFTSRGGGGG